MKAEAVRWTTSQHSEAQEQDDGRLYAAHAAANWLGIHRSTLYLAVRNGKLSPDAYTPGGHARFTMATLNQFRERLVFGSATGGESNATRALASAVASLSRFTALKPVCEVVVDATLEACTRLDTCLVVSYAHETPREEPALVAGKGLTNQLATEYRWLRRRPGVSLITSLTEHQGARLLLDDAQDISADAPEGTLKLLRASRFRSCVVLPCDSDGVTLGLLIGLGRNPCTFTDHEVATLGALADIVTAALRRSRRELAIQAQIKATEEMLRHATAAADDGSTAQHVATLRSVFQQATRAKVVCELGLNDELVTNAPQQLLDVMRLAADANAPQRACWLTDSGPAVAIATPAQSTHKQAAVGAYWRRMDLRSGMELAFLQVYAQACEIVAHD